MTYQLTSLGIGFALAITILILVRRAHLHGPHAFWWLALAVGIIILGIWPRLTDFIAPYLGVSYPPIVAILLGLALLLVKMMSMDLQRSHQEQRIRRLAQRLAILETQIGSGASSPNCQTGQPDQQENVDNRQQPDDPTKMPAAGAGDNQQARGLHQAR